MVVSEAANAWAVPWKVPCNVTGVPIDRIAALTACTASPKATPWARLNDNVTAGNCD